MIEKNLMEANLQELKNGYSFDADKEVYKCLICCETFEQGQVYAINNKYFEAYKAISLHVKEKHGHMLEHLLALDKKYTGITDNQKSLLMDFFNGLPDKEIAKKNEISSTTVRHQRFVFREKAKQAKAYLAIFELVEEALKRDIKEEFTEMHVGAKMVDERYETTNSEEEKILAAYFENSESLKLKDFPSKEKKKIVILRKIATLFEKGKKYSEKEINAALKVIYPDIATIRRYLIEYGFMERTTDCKEYWLKG